MSLILPVIGAFGYSPAAGDTTDRALIFDGNAAGHGLERTIAGATDRTFQFWMKADSSISGAPSIFASATGAEQIWYSSTDSTIRARSGNGSAVTVACSKNAWHHIRVRMVTGTVYVSVDGGTATNSGSGTPSEITSSGTHHVGQDDGPDNTFLGKIFDFICMDGDITSYINYSGGSWVDGSPTLGSTDYRLRGHNSDPGDDASGNDLDFSQSTASAVTVSAADMPSGA